MTIQIKNWLIALLIAAVGVLLYFLLRPTQQVGSVDTSVVDSLTAQIAYDETAMQMLDSMRQEQIISLTEENDSLRTKLSEKAKDLKATEKVVQDLVTRGRDIRTDVDTTQYDDNCEELAVQVSELLVENERYRSLGDSSFITMDKIIDQKNKQLSARDSLYSMLRGGYDKVATQYIDVAQKYNASEKKLRKARTVQKVIAGIALGAITGLLIAK